MLTRVKFLEPAARWLGLRCEVVPVRTADVKLLAPRPLKGGLTVDKATRLLPNRPLGIEQALDGLHAEWTKRSS